MSAIIVNWLREGVFGSFLFLSTLVAGAMSLAPRQPAWHQISTEPAVWICAAWTGGEIYDVQFRIRPDCSTRPIRLLFPTATLVQDSATSSPAGADAVTTRGAMTLSYEGPDFPVIYEPKLVRTISDDFPPTSSSARRLPLWSDYVDLAPGRETWFVLRFPLPPMKLDGRLRPDPESVPERFTIDLHSQDLGCSVPVTLRRSFPLSGREHLLNLGPRVQ